MLKTNQLTGRHRAAACLLVLVGGLVACRKPDTVPIETTEPRAITRLSSTVHAADPATEAQLKEGFHPVEQNAWRWVMRRFVVVLGPPEGAREQGAVLRLRFSLPEAVSKELGALTLSASVAGIKLEPQTYSEPGEYIYSREVPASVLEGDAVNVEFSFDKALTQSGVDRRELTVIVSSIALEAP